MLAHFAIALLLAGGATTTSDNAAAAEAAPADKPVPKKVCKIDPRATGTRIPQRICKTAEQWAKPEDGQQIQVQGRGGNPDPGSSTGPFGR